MKKMTRRESILTLASALGAGGFAARAAAQATSGSGNTPPTASGPAAGSTPASQAAQPSPADQAFEKFVDNYFDGFFQFDPMGATRAGIHTYDSELPAYSGSEIQAEIRRSRHALWALGKIATEALSPDNQFDARLLESVIRGRLLEFSGIRRWSKDPNFYTDLSAASLSTLIERDFASLDDRLKCLIARGQRIPAVLGSAQANVIDPPAVYTEVAIKRVQAQIGFLQNALPQVVARATSAPLKAQFTTVNQQVLTAYSHFLDYLQNTLRPQSQGSFALGAGNLRRMLLYDEMVDASFDVLLRTGHRELRRTQSLFTQTAQVLDNTKSPQAILRSLAQKDPGGEQILKNAQSVLDALREFLLTHEIVTIPPAPIPEVEETPSWMRTLSMASLDTPGPLEQHSIQSFLYLNLPLPNGNQAPPQVSPLFNPYAVRLLSIYQVYPGHYSQFLRLKGAVTKARKLEPSLHVVATNFEGWANYCQEMMLAQGYGEGDPKLLLSQLQVSLIQLCRLSVAIRMHTEGMSIEEAANVFQSEAYLDPVNAQREAIRGAFDPGYLGGALGKLEIMKLRGDAKQKLGEKFRLGAFHNRFLSFGIAPVKMIREQILEDNSPAL